MVMHQLVRQRTKSLTLSRRDTTGERSLRRTLPSQLERDRLMLELDLLVPFHRTRMVLLTARVLVLPVRLIRSRQVRLPKRKRRKLRKKLMLLKKNFTRSRVMLKRRKRRLRRRVNRLKSLHPRKRHQRLSQCLNQRKKRRLHLPNIKLDTTNVTITTTRDTEEDVLGFKPKYYLSVNNNLTVLRL